jgi:hypothetical protein
VMDPRAVILLIIGGALIGASFASVPAEDRARDWPVMAAAFTGAGLVAVVVLRRRAGLPVPPGQQASPAGGGEVIQMPVKAKAAALYRREALRAASAAPGTSHERAPPRAADAVDNRGRSS